MVAMSIARLAMAAKAIYMCDKGFFWVMTIVNFNILKHLLKQNNKVH
jgi:hypothetical protein